MKKVHLVGASLLALGMYSTSAAAEFYVGGHLGLSVPEDSGFDNAPNVQVNGGYQLNDFVGFHMSLIYLGRFSYSGGNLDATIENYGLAPAVKGILPVADAVSIYGLLGLYASRSEADLEVTRFDGTLVTDSDSASNFDAMVGAGVQFRLTEALSVYGEINYYDLDDDGVFSAGAGLRFRFR